MENLNPQVIGKVNSKLSTKQNVYDSYFLIKESWQIINKG